MDAPPDPLARLDARARPRVRVGVGAAVVLLLLALVTAVLVSAFATPPTAQVLAPADPTDPTAVTAAPSAPPTPATIFVHVLGAVRRSGLYELHAGARVMDAVAAAGGLTEAADPAGINLARPVGDGEQLYVPEVGETPRPAAPAAGAASGPGTGGNTGSVPSAPVNLNTATAADLETLPRIGPAMAQRILDYRAANGPFASVDDLRNISGIGDKTIQALTGKVTV